MSQVEEASLAVSRRRYEIPHVEMPTGRSWVHVLSALILRDFDYRFRHSKFEAVLVFLEPLFLVAFATMVRIIGFEMQPPYGPSFWTFHATGVFPYEMFVFCSQGMSKLRINGTEFPQVCAFDLIVARFIVDFLNVSTLTILFFAGLHLAGEPYTVPISISWYVATVSLIALLAFGVGLANTGIASVLPVWPLLYGAASRLSMLISGVLFVLDFMPPDIRYYISLNPLAQGIVMFRCGFYPTYPANLFSLNYFITCVIGVLAVGLIMFFCRREQH